MKKNDAKPLKEAVSQLVEDTVEIRVDELLKIVNDLRGCVEGASSWHAFQKLERIANDGANRRMGRLYPTGCHGPFAKTPKPKWLKCNLL